MTAENPPPPRPPVDDTKARNRFVAISVMRLLGVVMILFGILVVQGVVVLPVWTAWVVIALGMMQTFVTPTLLARMWSTNPRK